MAFSALCVCGRILLLEAETARSRGLTGGFLAFLFFALFVLRLLLFLLDLGLLQVIRFLLLNGEKERVPILTVVPILTHLKRLGLIVDGLGSPMVFIETCIPNAITI